MALIRVQSTTRSARCRPKGEFQCGVNFLSDLLIHDTDHLTLLTLVAECQLRISSSLRAVTLSCFPVLLAISSVLFSDKRIIHIFTRVGWQSEVGWDSHHEPLTP